MKYLTPPLNEARELLVQSDQNFGCERIIKKNDDMKNINRLTRVKLLSAFNFQVNNVGVRSPCLDKTSSVNVKVAHVCAKADNLGPAFL